MDEVIKLLIDNGYVFDGRTMSDTFRIITTSSYPFAGREVTVGGRTRLHLPETNQYVTVGKQVVCFYIKDKAAYNWKNLYTKNIEEIKDYLNETLK